MKQFVILLMFLVVSPLIRAQEEPSLETVFDQLGLQLNPEDEIWGYGATEGVFVQVADKVEVLLVAKYSFQKQPATSVVRAGYYEFGQPKDLRMLFECGPKAGDQSDPTGLPTNPSGKVFIDPGPKPFGFYAQSANFNPEFSAQGETVYTQDKLNEWVERFEHHHKTLIYPYKTKFGVRKNWYVICWEFSANDDYQDLVTVVRGVKLLLPKRPKDHYDLHESDAKRITMR